MAIKIFTPYKAEVKSFELREAYAGLLHPGCYRGYDSITSEGGNSYKIHHNKTGYVKTLSNNQADSSPSGVLIMPNGMPVHDNDPAEVNISDLGGASIRFDAIVGNINYIADPLTVGANFYYSVLEGVDVRLIDNVGIDTNIESILTNPEKQVLIGIVEVTSQQIRFIRNRVPNLADKPDIQLPSLSGYAHKNRENIFTDRNVFEGETLFNGLVQKKIRSIDTEEAGHLILGSDPSDIGVEYTVDLTSLDVDGEYVGFKQANRPYGNDPKLHLIPGTTINVRFTGSESAKFLAYDSDRKSGFYFTGRESTTRIVNNILYTIRLEEVITTQIARFSVSYVDPYPTIRNAIHLLRNEIRTIDTFNIENFIHGNFSLNDTSAPYSKTAIYKDGLGNVRIDLRINIQPTLGAGNYNLFQIPTDFRPKQSLIRGVVLSSNNHPEDVQTVELNHSTGILQFKSRAGANYIRRMELQMYYNVNDE